MSSFAKASKTNQKTHRERHQPEHRKHLGLLEKKKDYRKRAADQQEKKQTIQLLRKRALNKNPDEFYHHMINAKLVDGEHLEKKPKLDVDSKEQVELMQSQDIKYISMKRTMEANKIKRLQSQLHMTDAANETKNTHTFFVDSEQDAKKFDVVKHLDTHPALLGRRVNRLKLTDLEKLNLPSVNEKTMKEAAEEREKLYKELSKRIDREREFTVVQQKLEISRALKQKSELKPKKLQDGTKNSAPLYQFKYERKK